MDVSSRRRRSLAAVGAAASISMDTVSFAAATSLVTAVASLDPGVLQSSLSAAGLTVQRISVSPPELVARAAAPPPPVPPGLQAPKLGAVRVSPAAALANPGERITLFVEDVPAPADGAAPPVLTWSVASADASFNLSDAARVGTPLDGPTLGLLPGALQPGTLYTFAVRSAVGGAAASADVFTMQLPTGGTLAASVSSGSELSTRFSFATASWADANAAGAGAPLSYAFSYVVDGGGGAPVLLSEFGAAANVSDVLLPAGNVTVRVLARNALGGVSAAPATVAVVVTRQAFADAAAQASFLTRVVSSAASTNLSGPAALALASSAADMLNAADAPLAANASAAAEVRASLLAVIADCAATAATPEALESTAVAVASLVSNSTQVSPSGAASALATLAAVSAAGPLLSPASAMAVAAGLSSVAGAALTPSTGVSGAVVAAVADVVELLASSQFALLSTPGEPPLTVSSPLIQMYVALDRAGGGSRLFTEPLSAPDCASVFQPLPVGLFDAAGPAAASRVRTRFSALRFDPLSRTVEAAATLTGGGVTAASLNASALAAAVAAAVAPVLKAGARPLAAADVTISSVADASSGVAVELSFSLPLASMPPEFEHVLAAVSRLDAGALSAAGVSGVASVAVTAAFVPSAGVTTLAFSAADGSGELRVRDLITPILFSMPLSDAGAGRKAVCQWWDAAAGAYSTAGCATLPNPRPPGHTLRFRPGFAAAADADMAGAWEVAGSLVDGLNCSFQVLDCLQPDASVVFPNPARPFDVPAVACDLSAGATPLLVVEGRACALIQRDNPLRCWWDNQRQAFAGAGCVADAGATQCACRHVRADAHALALRVALHLLALTCCCFRFAAHILCRHAQAQHPHVQPERHDVHQPGGHHQQAAHALQGGGFPVRRHGCRRRARLATGPPRARERAAAPAAA